MQFHYRPPTFDVRDADHILVVQTGQIVERGSAERCWPGAGALPDDAGLATRSPRGYQRVVRESARRTS